MKRYLVIFSLLVSVAACSSSGGGDGGDDGGDGTLGEAAVLFGPEQVTFGTQDDEDPSLIRNGSGYLLAWFTEDESEGDLSLLRSEDGENWSDRSTISDESEPEFYPQLLRSRDGNYHAVWFQKNAGTLDMDLRYSTSDNLEHWSAPEAIGSAPGVDWVPTIIENGGRINVFWASNRTGNKEIFASTRSGGVWSEPRQVTQDGDDDDFPFVLRLNDGTFLLVWTHLPQGADPFSHSGSEIYYATSTNLTSWSAPTRFTVDFEQPFVDILPTAYLDGDTPHIAWTSNRTDRNGDIMDAPLTEPSRISVLVGGGSADYSPRVVPTDDEDTFLMAWVSTRNGSSTNRDIFVQRFRLPR